VIAGEKWVALLAVVLGGEFAASLYFFPSLKSVNYLFFCYFVTD
jgi:hypothetical protein